MALVEALGLSKVYRDRARGEVVAARQVSFECAAGEVLGLLGPNGAGKTTTLRMLSTVLAPSAGTANVAGHDLTTEPEAVRRAIGFLSATTGLYPRLTPRELLGYFGRLNGMDPKRLPARIESLAATFGLSEILDVRCEQLSTGMKQKVSIAWAVVHEPPVLILDEPTAGLDILVAAVTMEFIRSCRDRGQAVLFSTHIMSEAEKLCDRIAIIHQGRILASGTLDELRAATGKRYLEEIFMALVGSGGPELPAAS